MARKSDSISLNGKVLGVGEAKIASRVFRCLLFMCDSSIAATQVKNGRHSLQGGLTTVDVALRRAQTGHSDAFLQRRVQPC